MQHDDKNSKAPIKMRRLVSLLFIISLQLDYGLTFQLQVQQFVVNSVGGCGKFCGPDGGYGNNTGGMAQGCVGSLCTSTCSCSFAECEMGVCVCPKNYVPTSDRKCVYEIPVDSCDIDEDCDDYAKECFRDFCVCKTNYKFTIDRTCIAVLGSMCRTDEDCEYGENMICERDLCVCDFGYRETNDGSSRCVVDATCSNATCQFRMRDSYCNDNNFCVCPPDRMEFRGVCAFYRVALEDDCEFSWQCSNSDADSECKDTAKCDCMDGYTNENGVCIPVIACTIGGSCPDDACCQSQTANSFCDSESRTCMCENGYFEHLGGDNGTYTCRSLHLLGDPCNTDAECQAKTPNSVCFGGYCMCNDQTVKAYQCEPITILNSNLVPQRFTKMKLMDGKVVLKSKFYDTGTYPPDSVFAYSVDGPVGKILKVTVNHLVLAEGTTLQFFMSPWKHIAELSGLVNSHYDNFWFTTYQNCFTVVLISQAARAKGFEITVEVAEKSEGCCVTEYDVTGTAAMPQTIHTEGYPIPTNAPFCHIYLNPTRLTETLYLTLNTFDTYPLPDPPPEPFNYWDSVSTYTSRLVETSSFDTDTRTFMAYPLAGMTLVLNNFESTDMSSARVKLEGSVYTAPGGTTCGSDITVLTTAGTESYSSTNQHGLCIYRFTPDDPTQNIRVTIDEFTTTDGEDSVAIYSGDLVDDVIRPKLGAYDSSVTNKVFESTGMVSKSMFILIRIANTPNSTVFQVSHILI